MKKITLTADSNTTLAGTILCAGKLRTLLAVLLMVFAFGGTVSAQVGSVVYIDASHGGSGTNPESKGAESGLCPFAVSKNKSRVQYLISGYELMNYFKTSGGTITHVGFNILNLNASSNIKQVKNFTLKIWEITNSARTTYVNGASVTMNTSGYTLLAEKFYGNLNITTNGWYDLFLDDESFYYNPNATKSWVIEICSENEGDRAALNFAVSTHKTGGVNTSRGRYTTNDGITAFPTESSCALPNTPSAANNTTAYSQRNNRADMRFTYRCTTVTKAGNAAILEAGTGCVGSMNKLHVLNGETSSGLAYNWQSGPTLSGPWTDLGITTATALVPTKMQNVFYRRGTRCEFDGGNTELFSSAIRVDAAAVNEFVGGSWTKGYEPTAGPATESIKITNGTYVLTQDITACSCQVVDGELIVPSGKTLTLSGPIIDGGGEGFITFEDSASLIQTTTEGNSGIIKYKRNSQPMVQYDYTYWSSPVVGQTFGGFSPNTEGTHFYSFDIDTQNWASYSPSDGMEPGVGYIIRAPEQAAGTVFGGEFLGVPNNGPVSATVGSSGEYALIGNPYPSAVDADAFLLDVANSNYIDGTIYFWTHNTAPSTAYSGGNGEYSAYTADDYASYNLTGSVGTGIAAPSNPAGTEPGRYIGAGQSFMVLGTTSGGQVKFKNDMRVGGSNNTQFFRPANETTQSVNTVEKHRIWLQLENNNSFKQSLIGYVNGATNGHDYGFDGKIMAGGNISFYSILDSEKMAIQGRALPFNASDEVPMGFSTNLAGNHTISLYHFDGLFENTTVYLEDAVTGYVHNLSASAYTFSSVAGTFNDRFVIKYGNTNLATENVQADLNDVLVYKKNAALHIASVSNLEAVNIYDLSGRLLASRSELDAQTAIFENSNWSSQVLVVQITTADKIIITKKVVF